MNQISAHRRPRYRPTERLAILELKAARGWSLAQAAKRLLVAPATISSWQRRIDEDGPEALVQLPEPVNKFPEFVGYVVQRLKTLFPTLGKRKIAALLAREGLHLSATTITRMLHDKPQPVPKPSTPKPDIQTGCVVTAKQPNHVWHVDLTTVPTGSGFWVPWLPLALPQCWPFCWWVAVVVDHFSRRVMGTATFSKQPSSADVCAFLGRAIRSAGATPKYIVCDRGSQFDCRGFRRWCQRHGIKPRYGAIGQHGSIAVVERFIRTLKESLRCLTLVPLRRETFRREFSTFADWYNEHRPHETLGGRTPNEAYHRRFPAIRTPRYEPRERWPRGSPCAKPWALIRGRPGVKLELQVSGYAGRKHLPIITLDRVA
jgi:putative transposase